MKGVFINHTWVRDERMYECLVLSDHGYCFWFFLSVLLSVFSRCVPSPDTVSVSIKKKLSPTYDTYLLTWYIFHLIWSNAYNTTITLHWRVQVFTSLSHSSPTLISNHWSVLMLTIVQRSHVNIVPSDYKKCCHPCYTWNAALFFMANSSWFNSRFLLATCWGVLEQDTVNL